MTRRWMELELESSRVPDPPPTTSCQPDSHHRLLVILDSSHEQPQLKPQHGPRQSRRRSHCRDTARSRGRAARRREERRVPRLQRPTVTAHAERHEPRPPTTAAAAAVLSRTRSHQAISSSGSFILCGAASELRNGDAQ